MARGRKNTGGDNVVPITEADKEQGATRLANTKVRSGMILNEYARLVEIEDEMDDLIARHVTPLREERTRIYRGLKKDLNITREALGAQFKLYKLAARAVANREEDGGKALDDLRELQQTFMVDGEYDWVAVLEGR